MITISYQNSQVNTVSESSGGSTSMTNRWMNGHRENLGSWVHLPFCGEGELPPIRITVDRWTLDTLEALQWTVDGGIQILPCPHARH